MAISQWYYVSFSGLQFRFGDKLLETSVVLSPKRECSLKWSIRGKQIAFARTNERTRTHSVPLENSKSAKMKHKRRAERTSTSELPAEASQLLHAAPLTFRHGLTNHTALAWPLPPPTHLANHSSVAAICPLATAAAAAAAPINIVSVEISGRPLGIMCTGA